MIACILMALSAQVYETGFLAVDGVYNSELIAPYDILEHSRYRNPDRYFRCFVVSPDGRAITTAEGMRIEADYSFANCPKLDVLVIPSAEHSMDSDLENKALIDWVAERADQARVVMTLCDGAFVLAATGRLNGLNATTFPADQEALAKRFAEITVHRDLSFVQDGKYITSVGGAKSYDPALFLTEMWFDQATARRTGQGLVIDWQLESLAHKRIGPLPGHSDP